MIVEAVILDWTAAPIMTEEAQFSKTLYLTIFNLFQLSIGKVEMCVHVYACVCVRVRVCVRAFVASKQQSPLAPNTERLRRAIFHLLCIITVSALLMVLITVIKNSYLFGVGVGGGFHSPDKKKTFGLQLKFFRNSDAAVPYLPQVRR